MENQINNNPNSQNAKTITGIVLLGLGVLILFHQVTFFLFPAWIFSWPVILIIFGLYIGAKHNFRKSNWIVFTLLGVLFLLSDILPTVHIIVFWPAIIIAVGIHMLLRRNQRWNGDHWEKRDDNKDNNNTVNSIS